MNEREQLARFEELGEPRVRDLAPQWSGGISELAYKWLAAKETDREQSDLRDRAAQNAAFAEQAFIASRAADAAERAASEAARSATAAERQAVASEQQAREARNANMRATIALILAALSTAISTASTLGWLRGH